MQEEQDQEGEWMALAEAARRATEAARFELLRRQERNLTALTLLTLSLILTLSLSLALTLTLTLTRRVT